MKNIFKNLLVLLVGAAAALLGASLIKLNQIQAPTTVGLISSDGASLGLSTVGAGLTLNGGVLSASGEIPAVALTVVTAATPNAFPPPAGKTTCPIVFRNIPQANGVDYNIQAGSVVFTSAPQVGDVVQLICW